jgi:hypothetical protein
MTLNGLIAGIVGAKIPPANFTLRNFIEKTHGGESASVIDDEATLDHLFGIRPPPEVSGG